MQNDISNPSHYTEGRTIEPIQAIQDWELNFTLGNVVKYIARAGRKGDRLTDLLKARQYLEFEIGKVLRERGEASSCRTIHGINGRRWSAITCRKCNETSYIEIESDG